MNHTSLALLRLLACALWPSEEHAPDMSQVNWPEMYALSVAQAVPSLAFSGASAYKAEIPADVLDRWRSAALSIVVSNERIMAAQDQLIALMQANEIPCAVLKGSSLSVCYPQPELRPLGDIDLLVRPEDAERAKHLMLTHKYQICHEGHAFHLGFHKQGVSIELHRAVSTFPEADGAQAAMRFMAGALRETDRLRLGEHAFTALQPVYQAMSLLLHMERHMTTVGIGLRQLCDWMMFVASIDAQEFARSILPVLRQCGLYRFAATLTAICVRNLGMPQEQARWCADVEDDLCQQTLNDILTSGSMGRARQSDDLSSIFIERNMGRPATHPLVLLMKRCADSARSHFPIVRKYPALLPLYAMYTPVYLFASGKKKWSSLRGLRNTTKQRRQVYSDLHLYEAEKDK